DITNVGCFLEIVANRKLVWTVALRPGYRPSDPSFDVPAFTAIIMMEPHGKGTKYTALAMHKDEKDGNAHDRMGFSDGRGKPLDHLVAEAKTMKTAIGAPRKRHVQQPLCAPAGEVVPARPRRHR